MTVITNESVMLPELASATLLPAAGQHALLTDENSNLYVVDSTGAVTAVAPGYPTYAARLSSFSTNDPTVFELENSVGASITWTRGAEGIYVGSLSANVLNDNRVLALISPDVKSIGGIIRVYNMTAFSANSIYLESYDINGAYADGISCSIKIVNYPSFL